MGARPTTRCHWIVLLIAALVGAAGIAATPARAADAPIGRLGETLRVSYQGIVAEVTVTSVEPSPIPPGFGYPPRPPRQQVWRGNVTVRAVTVPNPYLLSVVFSFRGVTPSGDAYEPRNTDAPDALQPALLNAPAGSTVSGGVWWDCYRDLVSNVVLIDKLSGIHLAQWNLF
jgi:uncharacterized protein DUF1942